MKRCHKSYSKKSHFSRYFRPFIGVFVIFYYSTSIVIASGGYDNGTATGKGKLGLDLTWNPFNYFPEGQSYIVASYGLSEKFDIHGYYSIPASGSDNYYLGFFYQFYKNKYLDLASAVGIRQYQPKSEQHLFAPQLLYTIHLNDRLNLGGSVVNIMESLSDKSMRNRDKKLNKLGVAVDVGVFYRLKYKSQRIESYS